MVGIGNLSVEKDFGRWRVVEVAESGLVEGEGTASATVLSGRFRSLSLSLLESEELRLRGSSTSSEAVEAVLRRKGEERRPAPDLEGGPSAGLSRDFFGFAGEGEREAGSQDLRRSREVNDWEIGSVGVSVCSTSRCIAVFDVASFGRSLRRTSTRGFLSLISRGALRSVSGVESSDTEEESETLAEDSGRNPSREKPSKSPKELAVSSSNIGSLNCGKYV